MVVTWSKNVSGRKVMIINLKQYKTHGYVKGVLFIIRKIFVSLNQPILKEEITSWSGENVYHRYPKFVMEGDSDKFKCTSCHICEEVCPNKCISVDGQANVNSITVGNVPKSFMLNLSTCIQCNLCIDICPVDALSSSGSYAQSYFESKGAVDLKKIETEQFKDKK